MNCRGPRWAPNCRHYIFIIEFLVFEAIGNLLDLLNREIIYELEFLLTPRGVPVEGSPTVKLANGKEEKMKENM